MDVTLLVGNAAVICTVASNLAGLPLCLEFLDKKSTSGFSFWPFLAATINCTLWLQYGLLLGDKVLIAVNVISAFIQVCYLLSFYAYTADKNAVRKWLVISAFFLVVNYLNVFSQTNVRNKVKLLGPLASTGTITCAAAPLPGVVTAFFSRSREGFPLAIILAGFIVNTLWYAYGALIQDAFVKVPNLISAVLYGFQLCLFIAYHFKTATKPRQE